MQFQDLHAGLVIEAGPRPVTEAEILEFATRYDPQWFHIDRERAAKGRWKGLIASGWQTGAICMELMVKNVLQDSSSFGSPGMDAIRWLEPVRPGDALSLKCRVLECSVSASGGTGVVQWTWQLWNQAAVQVFEMTGTSLFALKDRPPPGA
jgi:acyl dehydratase